MASEYNSRREQEVLRRIDSMIGSRFGMLTVTKYGGVKDGKRMVVALCQCGNTTSVWVRNVTSGHTQSCGCHRKKRLLESVSTRDNASKRPLWSIYKGIVQRCTNKKSKAYPRYGGRGIKICDEWLNDYFAFERHVGDRPSPIYSIDRIDNNGDYEPGNVRWATQKEQVHNSSIVATKYMFNGSMCRIREIAKELGISEWLLRWRIKHWGYSKATSVYGKVYKTHKTDTKEAKIKRPAGR